MSHVEKTKLVFKGANVVPLLIAIFCGFLIWLIPVPSGIQPKAWHLLAVFVAFIVGLIGKALPMGGLSFLTLTFLIVSKILTVKEAFSGFSNPLIWLVVAAFLLSRSFIKTGLGMRIAYHLVALLGHKTLSLSYGICLTECLLAPAIPSNTARAGGVIYPVVRALAVCFDSTPERHSQRLIGSFLILTSYYSNLITSAMFVTAMAANPLIVAILNDLEIPFSWGKWALAAFVPGLISLIAVPYIVYKLYPPEIKTTPEAKKMAEQHLADMGDISRYEWITTGVFVLLILLWTLGDFLFGLEGTTVALIGICILMLTGVLTWEDIKKEHEAWDTLIWFATLVTIASFLNQFGLIEWASQHIQSAIGHFPWGVAWILLVAIYFYSHYLFASNTAHITSMYAAFLNVGIALAIPEYLIALSLAYCSSLFACLTHYGTGSAPILFGSEYVNIKTWWRMGLLMSFFFMLIWLGIGSLWWKLLGLW